MPRYKITIEYDGTNLLGWQRQLDGPSVQEHLENALFAFTGQQREVCAAGRTDAGVHALAQVAHFDTDSKIENLNKFVYSLNGILEKDIRILRIEETELHARFSAKKKTGRNSSTISKNLINNLFRMSLTSP